MSVKLSNSSFIQASSVTKSKKHAGKLVSGLIAPYKFAAHNIRIAFKGSTSVKVDLTTKQIFKVKGEDRVKPGILRRISHGIVGFLALLPLLNIIPYVVAKKMNGIKPKNLEEPKKVDEPKKESDHPNFPQPSKMDDVNNSSQKTSSLDVKTLSAKELLERCSGLSLDEKTLDLDIDRAGPEEKKIIGELFSRISKMREIEVKELLGLAKSSPEKFVLLATTFASNGPYVIGWKCDILEQADWPSEALKQKLLPQLLTELIFERRGIAWDNWNSGFVQTGEGTDYFNTPGFSCNRILINMRDIFGHGDFTKFPKSISPYLVQSIGAAIKMAAERALKELKESHQAGPITKDTCIGLEVRISQFSQTRFPGSMIAPLLPHLKEVPGLVSLDLSDVGIRTSMDASLEQTKNGFKDENLPAFIEIFNTNPHLQQVNVNIDGMSEEGAKKFKEELERVMKEPNRCQQPSVEWLLSHIQPEGVKPEQ